MICENSPKKIVSLMPNYMYSHKNNLFAPTRLTRFGRVITVITVRIYTSTRNSFTSLPPT
jgi:hypothetical protein